MRAVSPAGSAPPFSDHVMVPAPPVALLPHQVMPTVPPGSANVPPGPAGNPVVGIESTSATTIDNGTVADAPVCCRSLSA